MAFEDLKITQAERETLGTVALPDRPQIPAQSLKAHFDALGNKIADKFNSAMDEMKPFDIAEAARAAAELAREAAENGRKAAEAARVLAEQARDTAEGLRTDAEAARTRAEQARKDAETARASAEAARAAAEQTRGANESLRIAAEEARARSETARAAAERARVDAETARAKAEQARTEAEALRKTAEDARANEERTRQIAENARKLAEEARVLAETLRTQGEDRRKTAEETRTITEAERAAAELIRDAAETIRKENEAGRVNTENARNVWEDYDPQKDYYPGNKVAFNGSSYLNIRQSKGNVPTETAYWRLIAARGVDGEGAGDMLASIYDPTGKEQDVYKWATDAAQAVQDHLEQHAGDKGNPHGVTAAQVGAATPSSTVNVALLASNWVGTTAPFTQTISVSGLTTTQNGYIGSAQYATAVQRKAASSAQLAVTGQTAGSLTITADGKKPVVNIPCTVTILG